jgi:hypothetical protein
MRNCGSDQPLNLVPYFLIPMGLGVEVESGPTAGLTLVTYDHDPHMTTIPVINEANTPESARFFIGIYNHIWPDVDV